MDRSSFFIKDKALFGSYPTQESVNELENKGIRYFINLTCDGEKNILQYSTKYNYIHFPITDNSIPKNINVFSQFISTTCNIIKNLLNDDKIYLHCKGGHGRAGLVVASILVIYYNISSEKALYLTNKYHSYRLNMNEKWRKIGSPQTYTQKKFVNDLFCTLYVNSKNPTFSINTYHNIILKDIGHFFSIKDAFLAIKKLVNDHTKWNKIKKIVMFILLYNKFNNDIVLKSCLLNTGFKHIIYKNLDINTSSDDIDYNIIGKLLIKVRTQLLNNEIF